MGEAFEYILATTRPAVRYEYEEYYSTESEIINLLNEFIKEYEENEMKKIKLEYQDIIGELENGWYGSYYQLSEEEQFYIRRVQKNIVLMTENIKNLSPFSCHKSYSYAELKKIAYSGVE